MREPGLFDHPPYAGRAPFVKGSETSEEAANKLGGAASLRRRVFEHIDSLGDYGATDEEIDTALGVKMTARPRRCELLAAGYVRDSGKRRLTRNNRQAVVWVTA